MKYVNNLLAFAAILCLLLNASCKKKSDPTPNPPSDTTTTEAPGGALVGTWSANSADDIAYDGANTDIPEQYADFSITMDTTDTGVSYTTTGSDNDTVYPASGNFTGIDEDTDFSTGAEVTRSPDNIATTLTLSEDETVLTISFTIAEESAGLPAGNARVSSVSGNYEFTLTKE